MCNLHSLDKGQDAIRKAFGVDHDEAGNLPPLPAIFPDQMAPVVRLADGERALATMRWGFPSPTSKGLRHPVTNVRNVKSPYWRPWLKPEQRCLVPVFAFSEYADTKPRKTPVWFALERGPATVRLRRDLAALDGRARPEARRARRGGAPPLCLPHMPGERRRRTGASEGHAGSADDAGGMANVVGGAGGGGVAATATAAGRRHAGGRPRKKE